MGFFGATGKLLLGTAKLTGKLGVGTVKATGKALNGTAICEDWKSLLSG